MMSLTSAIAEFLIEQQVRGNSPKTVLHYRRVLGFFHAFADDPQLDGVTLALCKQYCIHLARQAVTTTTVQTYIRGLRAFLTWCYNEGHMEANIPARLRLPRAQRKAVDVLTDAEAKRLLSCFDTGGALGARNYAICALMLDSGLRLNEVVTLPIGALHVREGYAIVDGKGSKQRVVPLGEASRSALERYIALAAPRSALFVKADGGPLEQSTVKDMFRKLKHRADIPRLHPHLLRHSFATRYLENGGDIYSLQMILGHTSLEMVKRYVHLASSRTVAAFPKYSPLDNLVQDAQARSCRGSS